MFFIDLPIEENPFPRSARRRGVAVRLIELFARAFPNITYRLLWESSLVNAQAWRLGEARNVQLYGGLVRHPAIRKAGLAVALAHETGHHLGGPPFDPDLRWMTWQGQADYWAASIGMPRVFGLKARRMTLRGAREILQIHKDLGQQYGFDEADLSPECRLRIFRAGASKADFPTCAKTEYRNCFDQPYPHV